MDFFLFSFNDGVKTLTRLRRSGGLIGGRDGVSEICVVRDLVGGSESGGFLLERIASFVGYLSSIWQGRGR